VPPDDSLLVVDVIVRAARTDGSLTSDNCVFNDERVVGIAAASMMVMMPMAAMGVMGMVVMVVVVMAAVVVSRLVLAKDLRHRASGRTTDRMISGSLAHGALLRVRDNKSKVC